MNTYNEDYNEEFGMINIKSITKDLIMLSRDRIHALILKL